MSQIIDRRLNAGKKSTVNRQRFLRRYKNQIKRAVSDAVSKRSITEIDQGEEISIPARDISEPRFYRGHGGRIERVLPGNDQFQSGDRIKRPSGGEGGGAGDTQASNTGEGEDEFVFQLSREEFLELYFEDLELPDLVKKELARMTTYKTIRAGITSSGIPANINVVRSMRQAAGRRMALASPYKHQLRQAEEELERLETNPNAAKIDILRLKKDIDFLKKKIKAVPFIDTIDLRYNNRIRVLAPSTQAVMFCVMDVSGSMDEAKKDVAKRFFILLYLFLTRNYEKIELVFIRHHTSAKEVDEDEFFYSRETGGTVVSSALELLSNIIEARYPPSAWNIYVAQASDGDNWNADSPYCQELLQEKIMPLLQYFAYIEIMPRHHQSLWEVYQQVRQHYPNFAMENIDDVTDIYPVFRELFKRKTS
ncbi:MULTISPECIES: YeaH/YhbH family protein [unclassified Legionella]|uniref:YeaH/YhbH family protein n=1 Tax=unclassified Legionella TaxID=2622702 RepID=UPI0010556C50|nr:MULTISPECIES: YeaH/YhbH family protein [unclassified Legionella]MDI9819057.1 YeaH/YhbH family protein [Legionella sp. PL877]